MKTVLELLNESIDDTAKKPSSKSEKERGKWSKQNRSSKPGVGSKVKNAVKSGWDKTKSSFRQIKYKIYRALYSKKMTAKTFQKVFKKLTKGKENSPIEFRKVRFHEKFDAIALFVGGKEAMVCYCEDGEKLIKSKN